MTSSSSMPSAADGALVGTLRLLLLAALLTAGCSVVVAGLRHDHDLTVLRAGATRDDVEDELGRPEEVLDLGGSVEAIYTVRIGQDRDAGDNLAAVGGIGGRVFGEMARGDDSGWGVFLGILIAVPAMVGTDTYLTVRELTRRSRAEVVVVYDGAGRVRSYELPAGPGDKKTRTRRR